MSDNPHTFRRRDFLQRSLALSAIPVFPGLLYAAGRSDGTSKVSLPGTYRGYSQAEADGFVRRSRYVEVFDGTRIALDCFRPTLGGNLLTGQRPLVAVCTGYRRSWVMSKDETPAVRHRWPHQQVGDFASQVLQVAQLPDQKTAQWPAETAGMKPQQLADWLLVHGSVAEYLLVYGYNIAVIDTRGTGASYGDPAKNNATTIGHDLADIFAWCAEQSWCNGNIGMVGPSWHGAVQHMALTYGTQPLKAVIPQVAPIDQYLGLWPGGIYNVGLMRDWLKLRASQDNVAEQLALPVDEDESRALLKAAMAQRQPSAAATTTEGAATDAATVRDAAPVDIDAIVQEQLAGMASLTRDYFQAGQLLDKVDFADGSTGDISQSPLDFDRANRGSTAVYSWGGWWDVYARETPLAHANLTNPRKLMMGPWNHDNDWALSEAHRWFDHWLKNVPNGIMDEPAVTFATAQASALPQWRHSTAFPPQAAQPQLLSLGSGGQLLAGAHEPGAVDRFTVNYATTSGPGARAWGFSLSSQLDYSTLNDAIGSGLSYTTAPLSEALDICGFPAVRMVVSSSTTEAKVFAYLRSITPEGQAYCIAEGWFDCKFRKASQAPYDNLGMTWYSYASTDVQPVVPGELMTATIDFTPIAWRVPAGHRLQLLINGADKDNGYQQVQQLPPELSIHVGGEDGTVLTLPVLPTLQAAPPIDGAFEQLPGRSGIGVKPA